MVLFLEGKWPRLILAAYLAIAIMGLFTFAAAGPLRSLDSWDNDPFSESFFTSIDLAIDCLAEGETIMSRAGRYSFSPLRTGFLRLLMLNAPQNAGSVLAQSSLKAIEKVNYLDIKNTILLKLRI
ncbi:hypothetical protein AGMMS49579_22980 [Spirochaetia bacterium]|nr:hypothetical protein AGMMS49579_22980 [Spirochaetia bacterium]